MAPSYVFAASILCLYFRFCVCFDQSDRISDLRLCVDPECKGIISYAKTLLRYSGDHPMILSFDGNKEVKVFSKSAGKKPDLWGGEINGQRGYFPRTFVREYKVFVKNPDQVVPTERDSLPATVEGQKSNNTYAGDGLSTANVSTAENIITNGEPHAEKTSNNQTADSEIEEKKREEKSPLTRRLLSLDDQESLSVQETLEQMPSPPVPLADSPIQIKTDGVIKGEVNAEEPKSKPSEVKSFVVVDGTKVEVDTDQDETPDLVTLQPTRTPDNPVIDSVSPSNIQEVPASVGKPSKIVTYMSPTVIATQPPTTTAAETPDETVVTSNHQDEISPTSSSSGHGAEATAEETGEVQYAADMAKPAEDASEKTSDAWFEDTGSTSTNEEIVKEEDVTKSSSEEHGEGEVTKEDDKEVLDVEEKVVDDASSEAKGIFSHFFKQETDDKVNVSEVANVDGIAVNDAKDPGMVPVQKPVPEDSAVVDEKDDVDDDTAVDDGDEEEGDDEDGIGDGNDVDDEDDEDQSDNAVDETDAQNFTVAAVTDTEEVSSTLNGKETDANNETVAMKVDADVGDRSEVDGDKVVKQWTESLSELNEQREQDVGGQDKAVLGQGIEVLGQDIEVPGQDVEVLGQDIEVETVTPYNIEDTGDDGHCVDCEATVTEIPPFGFEEPLTEEEAGAGSESWKERWQKMDVKETAKPYVEVIGTYTQMIVDVLPEPLYVMLLDLQERAVSPRVVVFTVLVGIFTFFIGFTYFALYYKIKGSGTFLAAKLSSLDQKLFTAITERNCLHDTVTTSERKIEILEDELRSANNSADTFKRHWKVSQNECEELRVNAVNLEEQLETAVQTGLEVNRMLYEFLTSQSDNLKLQRALENMEKELHQQKTAVSEMNADAVDTVHANLRLKQELEDAQVEVTLLQEQNTNLLADAMSAETMRESLELQLSNQNEELEQLRSSNEQLLKEVEDWNVTVKALERQVATITQENLELKGALALKKTELQSLEELVSQMKPNEEQDSGDMLAKVLDVARLKGELKSVAAERDTLQSKLKYEAAVKEQLEEQLFAGASDVERMRKELMAALNAKDDAEKRLQVLSSYFKEKEMELQKELGLQQAKRQQTQETAVTSNQKAALYEQEVFLYKSQIDSLKKEIEDQERSFKMQVAEHEKKAHNNWLAARNAERRLEEMKRESSMLRNKLTSMDQDKDSQTRSNPDGTTLQTNSSRFYGVNGESNTSPSPNPGSLPPVPGDLPPPPPSSGPSSLYHEPIDFRRLPHHPFLPQDRPLPPPHFLNHMPPPPMHPFADRGPGGPMMPMFPGPPPHLYDRGMPSPPPEYRFGPPPPPPPLYPIPRRRSPPQSFESVRRSPSPFDGRVPGPGSRTPGPERPDTTSMPLPSRQWLPNIDARRDPVVPSSRQDLIHDPRTSSPLTSEVNKPTHGRNSAV